jgi:hypothetical protein
MGANEGQQMAHASQLVLTQQLNNNSLFHMLLLCSLHGLCGENYFALNLSTRFYILYTYIKRLYKMTRYKIGGTIFGGGSF